MNESDLRSLRIAGIAIFKISNQRIEDWSCSAAELYGYSDAEVLNRSVDFLCVPGESTVLMTPSAVGPETEEGWGERHRRGDGREIFVDLRFAASGEGWLVVAQDVTERRAAALRASESQKALGSNRAALRRLAGRLLDAQESEKRRIARRLHDDFTQRLAALGFELTAISQKPSNPGPAEQVRRVRQLEEMANQVMELGGDVRRISHDLHPAALERLGLTAALESHAATLERRHGIEVRVTSHDDGSGDFPNDVALALYRISQEALENVVRHADARQVHVTLVREPGTDHEDQTVRLALADDGAGFDLEEMAEHGGLGLASIEERARLLGGRLRIASTPGAGTELEVVLPVAKDVSRVTETGGAQELNPTMAESLRLIGPYRVESVLGEGATATVYQAKEPPPLAREVAIKIFHAPLTSHRKTLLFKAERQALARLRHPNIGQIHEARTTAAGEPYLVMEYVPGMPITNYCDRYRLDLRQRLQLFVTVAQAVQHIHQKSVLHRDLKPGNVLVMEQDGRPTPKILDFGIAKGLDRPLTDLTVWTLEGAGTPAYLSPEVLAGDEADTRSEVFALGMILFELLTGVLPKGAGTPESSAGNDFELPSRRLTDLEASQLISSAENRQLAPRALVRSLCGDLDWISNRALALDPESRYVSAAALAEDITRHLGNAAVEARPPDFGYRLSRLLRRHRPAMAATLAVIVALVGGLTVATWQARLARKSATAAEQARVEAERVTEFLEGMFEVSGPAATRGEPMTARQILDRGAERLERELTYQPRIRARLLETVGHVYNLLGYFDAASSLLEKSLDLRLELFGEEHEETARSLRRLGSVQVDSGHYQAGRELLERALGIQERFLGPFHPELAWTLNTLARLRREQGAAAEASALYKQAYEIVSRALPPEHPQSIQAHSSVALAYEMSGDAEQALSHYLKANELGEKHLGADHPDVLMFLNKLASFYRKRGDSRKSIEVFERLIPRLEKVYGARHSHVLNIRLNLAMAYTVIGESERALNLAESCLRQSREARGLQRSLAHRASGLLATIHQQRGEYLQAEAAYQHAIESAAELGAMATAGPKLGIALAALAGADLDRAADLAAEIESLLGAVADAPRHLAFGLQQLEAELALRRGDLERAESMSRELASHLANTDMPWEAARNQLRLGRVLLARGDSEAGTAVLEPLIAAMELRPIEVEPQGWRATALLLLGRVNEARPVAHRALSGSRDPLLLKLCRQHGIEIPSLGDKSTPR